MSFLEDFLNFCNSNTFGENNAIRANFYIHSLEISLVSVPNLKQLNIFEIKITTFCRVIQIYVRDPNLLTSK